MLSRRARTTRAFHQCRHHLRKARANVRGVSEALDRESQRQSIAADRRSDQKRRGWRALTLSHWFSHLVHCVGPQRRETDLKTRPGLSCKPTSRRGFKLQRPETKDREASAAQTPRFGVSDPRENPRRRPKNRSLARHSLALVQVEQRFSWSRARAKHLHCFFSPSPPIAACWARKDVPKGTITPHVHHGLHLLRGPGVQLQHPAGALHLGNVPLRFAGASRSNVLSSCNKTSGTRCTQWRMRASGGGTARSSKRAIPSSFPRQRGEVSFGRLRGRVFQCDLVHGREAWKCLDSLITHASHSNFFLHQTPIDQEQHSQDAFRAPPWRVADNLHGGTAALESHRPP